MNRVVSISSLFAIIIAFSGCAADRGAGDDGEVVSPAVVGAGDTGATCDPNDPACNEAPCDPGDTNCDPKVPPIEDPCAPHEVKSDETCDQLLGYAWDGKSCYPLNGCACIGPDCGELFASEEKCIESFKSCAPQSWCEETAETLAVLLAAARECNIASMKIVECDGTFVDTTFGCPVPVASGSSDVTLKYLAIFKEYAQNCPLPVPACPNPEGLTIDCVQGPNQDSLIGSCSVVTDSTGAVSE